MKYNAPVGISDPNAGYILGNPVTGTAGSIPPATAIEFPQREIINAIIAADLVPSNDDLTQLVQAIEILGRIPYAVDQGSVNQVVIDPLPVITAYQIPLAYAVRVAFSNTGPTTINVSGIG